MTYNPPTWYRGPDDPSGYRVRVAGDLRQMRGREGLRLTQAALAKVLGQELGRDIPDSSVARWESGSKLAGADVYLACIDLVAAHRNAESPLARFKRALGPAS